MRVGLSSDAAPGATIAELLDTCERRGLGVLELRVGGVDTAALHDVLRAGAHNESIAGLFADDASYSAGLVSAASASNVTVVLDSGASYASRMVEARRAAPRGCTVLPLMSGPAVRWLDAAVLARVPFAWQIDETCTDPAGDAAQILHHASLLAYVRLVGGGPEGVMQEGRGIGAVMKQLTLAGYAGPLILTPSSPRYRVAWATWLGRRGGWGCGSKAERSTSLKLATRTGESPT
jgi:hypothetical protein